MALDVETILTDDALLELAGDKKDQLKPTTWVDLKPAKQYALDRLLDGLRRRDPPIYEADLAQTSELMPVLRDGALAHLYRLAMNSADADEIFVALAKHHEDLFVNGLLGLRPTLSGGEVGFVGMLSVARR